MIVLSVFLLSIWIALLCLLSIWIIFRKILPKYKITSSEVSFEDLMIVLNATINTELELWEKDVFKNQDNSIGLNSRYENYYHEISMNIVKSLSPIYFENIGKYLTEDAVVSIIGRRIKIFLNEHVSSV